LKEQVCTEIDGSPLMPELFDIDVKTAILAAAAAESMDKIIIDPMKHLQPLRFVFYECIFVII